VFVPIAAKESDILAHNYLVWWGAQLFALAVLIFLFLRWKPAFLGGKTVGQTLGDALDARNAQIKDQLEAAERSRQEAARIREQSQRDIEQARTEAAQIVERAHSTSAAIRQEIETRAQDEAKRVVAQAADEIDFERRQAEQALRRRAADIVVDAAGQIVQRNLDPQTDQRLIAQSLQQMGDGQ